MPRGALHTCRGCQCLIASGVYACGVCAERLKKQQRAREDETRGTSSERGYNTRWKQYRERYLAKNPICVDPYARHTGQTRGAAVVDHITPHKGSSTLFWDKTNHQSLCLSCHGYKSAIETGGRSASAKHVLPPASGVYGVSGEVSTLPSVMTGVSARRV